MTKLLPKRRFKEFKDSEAWEQRAFSDLVIRVSKSSNDYMLPRVEYEDIVSGQGELNKDIFTKKSDKRGIEFEADDTLFGYLRPYLKNWMLAEFKGIAVGDWWVLRPNEMDSKFIYSLVRSNKFQLVANLSTGTKMPRSDWKVVSQTKFVVPIDKYEQMKIGSIFRGLDHLITLHQRKLKKLKNLKSAYLSEMFPKDGELYPNRRFAGFTDPWERRKLGDVVTIKSGWSPSNFVEGSSLYVKVDDLNYSNREQDNSQMKVKEDSRYSKVKIGSTIFPKRGAAIMTNKVRILAKDSYMDTNMMALQPDGIDGEFLYTFICRTGLYKIADTSTIPQINNKHIEPYEILIPSNEEQAKIAGFFKSLDHLITLQQRKLKKLEDLKQAYLSEMFV